MIKKQSSLTRLALILLCLCVAPLAHADARLEDMAIMALGPLDGRAVVKSADGKMHVLTVGDKMPGTQATVLQVLADKLVVEEEVGKEGQPKVKQTAWLMKAAKAGVPGSVQRFDTQGPAPVQHEITVMKPLTKPVTESKANPKSGEKAKLKTEVKAKAEDKSKATPKAAKTATPVKK